MSWRQYLATWYLQIQRLHEKPSKWVPAQTRSGRRRGRQKKIINRTEACSQVRPPATARHTWITSASCTERRHAASRSIASAARNERLPIEPSEVRHEKRMFSSSHRFNYTGYAISSTATLKKRIDELMTTSTAVLADTQILHFGRLHSRVHVYNLYDWSVGLCPVLWRR